MSSNTNTVKMNINITDREEELKATARMIENIMRSEGDKNYEDWQAQERKFAEYLREGQPYGLNTPKMQKWIDLMKCKKAYILGLLIKTWGSVWDLAEQRTTLFKQVESLKEEVFTYMQDPNGPVMKEYIKNVGKDILDEYGKLKGIEKIMIAEVKKREELETDVAHHKGIIKQYEQLTDANEEVTVASTNPDTGEYESYKTTMKKQIEYNCAQREKIDELQKKLVEAGRDLINCSKELDKRTETIKSQKETIKKQTETMKTVKKEIEKMRKEDDRCEEKYKALLKKYQEEKKALSNNQIQSSDIVKVLKKTITELTSSLATRTKQYEDYKRKMKKSRRK